MLPLPLDHFHLDVGDGFGRVEALGASLRAIHNGVAAIQSERVFQIVQAFTCRFVALIVNPARGLQQNRWS